MIRIISAAVLVLLLASCGDNAFFELNKSLTDHTWNYHDAPAFQLHIDDKEAKYDVFINIRHGADYDFSNIFVLLHQSGPQLLDTAYRKEITLAQLDGRWLGNSAGSLYEIQYLAHQNFVFPDTGIYTFQIEQNMRQNPLLGISDVGIKLVKK